MSKLSGFLPWKLWVYIYRKQLRNVRHSIAWWRFERIETGRIEFGLSRDSITYLLALLNQFADRKVFVFCLYSIRKIKSVLYVIYVYINFSFLFSTFRYRFFGLFVISLGVTFYLIDFWVILFWFFLYLFWNNVFFSSFFSIYFGS